MTNKERLQTMSDDELVSWIYARVKFCELCPNHDDCIVTNMKQCTMNIRKWLKEEIVRIA